MSNTWYAHTTNPDYRIFLTTDKLNAQQMIDFARCDEAGDVIYFGGTTRNNFKGKTVVSLSYEAQKSMALKTLVSLADKCMTKFNGGVPSANPRDRKIHRIGICHRLGRVPTGEESVIIVVSTSHREEGWASASWLLDRIKERAEIWKLEEYDDGSNDWKQNANSAIPK